MAAQPTLDTPAHQQTSLPNGSCDSIAIEDFAIEDATHPDKRGVAGRTRQAGAALSTHTNGSAMQGTSKAEEGY
jgi:hypothetical protein